MRWNPWRFTDEEIDYLESHGFERDYLQNTCARCASPETSLPRARARWCFPLNRSCGWKPRAGGAADRNAAAQHAQLPVAHRDQGRAHPRSGRGRDPANSACAARRGLAGVPAARRHRRVRFHQQRVRRAALRPARRGHYGARLHPVARPTNWPPSARLRRRARTTPCCWWTPTARWKAACPTPSPWAARWPHAASGFERLPWTAATSLSSRAVPGRCSTKPACTK